MKKLKRLLICFMFTLIVIFSTGCANIQYQRAVYENGTIIDAISVKLDNDKITEKGYNIEKVTNDVKIKMQQYINAIVNSFYNRNDGLLEIEKIAVYNNLRTLVTTKNDYIVASIEFRNYNTFKYFYGLHLNEGNSTSSDDIVEGFLFNKNVSTGKTIFSGADAEYITNEFIAYFDNNFTIEDCDLSYIFGTIENKLHSNADYTFKEDGVTYHQWFLNSKDDTISTFTFQMKPVNWYILALVLTAILIIVLFVVSLFVKKKKSSNTFENNNFEIKSIQNFESNNENN